MEPRRRHLERLADVLPSKLHGTTSLQWGQRLQIPLQRRPPICSRQVMGRRSTRQ